MVVFNNKLKTTLKKCFTKVIYANSCISFIFVFVKNTSIQHAFSYISLNTQQLRYIHSLRYRWSQHHDLKNILLLYFLFSSVRSISMLLKLNNPRNRTDTKSPLDGAYTPTSMDRYCLILWIMTFSNWIASIQIFFFQFLHLQKGSERNKWWKYCC